MRVRAGLSDHAMEGEGEPLAGTATLVSTTGSAGRAFGETVLGAEGRTNVVSIGKKIATLERTHLLWEGSLFEAEGNHPSSRPRRLHSSPRPR